MSVAYILSEMHADRDIICVAPLYDTIEDKKATKGEIADLLNKCIS